MQDSIIQFSTTALKEEGAKARSALLTIHSMIEAVTSAPWLGSVAPELRAIQDAAIEAGQAVSKLDQGIKRYEEMAQRWQDKIAKQDEEGLARVAPF
jgi:hypothetical protein